MQKLFTATYGSKLYGTSTETSDTDLKTIYLPSLDSLMLCKNPPVYKMRYDANGDSIGPNVPTPDNGTEEEFFPLQTFARDFLKGQTYALEVANAAYQAEHEYQVQFFGDSDTVNLTRQFISLLVEHFTTSNVSSMMGFAKKQTFDYVYRGERLAFAKKLQDILNGVVAKVFYLEADEDDGSFAKICKLSHSLDFDNPGVTVLDYLLKESGLSEGVVENNNRVLRAINLNGRLYSETTSVHHLSEVVQKLINSYGTRSHQASLSNIEYKSMSHAIRVYHQSLEILETSKITFPPPNADFLLDVKQGKISLDQIIPILKELEEQAQEKLMTTKVQSLTRTLREALESNTLQVLKRLYERDF